MKVGFFIKGEGEVFENGCNQQALFVYQTFVAMDIECTFFTTDGSLFLNIPTVNINTYFYKIYDLDIFITLSGVFSETKIYKQIYDNNVSLIHYNCGNIMYIFKEDILFDCHDFIKDNILERYKYLKQYWVIPNYTNDVDFYKSITGTTVYTAPYVWNTDIIDLYNKNGAIEYDTTLDYGNTRYIVIAEANMQSTKNCMYPLLICNDLYKVYKNIKVILLCKPNTNAFVKFCQNLDIHKDGLVEYYPRIKYVEILRQFKENCLDLYLLSHHKDNPLNFLHLETLYLNYPLIHNCEKYKKAGYYYTKIDEGVKQLLHAFKNHKSGLQAYVKETRKVLDVFSPYNKTNQIIYKRYLDSCINKYSFVNNDIDKNNISKIIFQTSLDSPSKIVLDCVKKYFPDYNYYHFKDQDIINFINSNPIKEFPNAIDKFHFFKGAHKADFFRYYFLYLNGGVFLDSDAMIHCNIKDIIQNYSSVYIKSNFFKHLGFSHIFNGFICSPPKSPIMYEALKHMYNCTVVNDYQMFCKELLVIINKLNVPNVKIYDETINKVDNCNKSIILNNKGVKILTHYFQEKHIPQNHK